MEDTGIVRLKRELKLKKFQFNSIFEFSESIYSSFQIENIIRIFFSTLMGQFGISRLCFYDSDNKLFEKRGFVITEDERKTLQRQLKGLGSDWFYLKIDEMGDEFGNLKEMLLGKKIYYLVNVSESEKETIAVGLGLKYNKKEYTKEDIEFIFFVSRFSQIAVHNATLINRLIENKRMEHEMKIARDIQLSLLPQDIPELENFEIGVIYEPINEVGGDYYDILKHRKGLLPILIADVEGKGLPAALLAASSQAIFRSLNELYFFEADKFIKRANNMIFDFTRGSRFITLFWLLLDDESRSISYVNAGHVAPFILSGNRVISLDKGGFLTGFMVDADYEQGTVSMKPGDILVAFTDGITEVENKEKVEFGEEGLVEYFKKNRELSAQEMALGLYQMVQEYNHKKKLHDDCTLIVLKAR